MSDIEEDFGFGEWQDAPFPSNENAIPILKYPTFANDDLHDQERKDYDFSVTNDTDSSDDFEGAALEVYQDDENDMDEDLQNAMKYLNSVRQEAKKLGKVSTMKSDTNISKKIQIENINKNHSMTNFFKSEYSELKFDESWEVEAVNYFFSVKQLAISYSLENEEEKKKNINAKKFLKKNAPNLQILCKMDSIFLTKIISSILDLLSYDTEHQKMEIIDEYIDTLDANNQDINECLDETYKTVEEYNEHCFEEEIEQEVDDNNDDNNDEDVEKSEDKNHLNLLNINYWLLFSLSLLDDLVASRDDVANDLHQILKRLYICLTDKNLKKIGIFDVDYNQNLISTIKLNWTIITKCFHQKLV